MTKEELIAFENDIAALFNAGKIRAPVHLYHGNEEQIIDVFRNIRPRDWVFCSWRSHYQCLLKGVPASAVRDEILAGRSISLCFPEYRVYSSAIVGGVLPIAGFYIYSGMFATSPIVLVPLLFLAFSSAVGSGLKHLPADRETGKRTVSVLLGDRAARGLILLGLGLGVATSAGLVPLGYLSRSSLLFTVPLPALLLAVCLKHVRRATFEDLVTLRKFKGALHMTILFTSLGLAFGLARG